jgi:quinol monooxygenase YgiN
MILAIIEMDARPAKRKELLQTLHALIQELRNEKVCIKCSACQDIEAENSFCLIEEWKSQLELDNHLRSDIFTVLLGAKNLLSKPLEFKFNSVSSTAGMEAVKSVRGKLG